MFTAFAQNKALDGCLKQVKALSPATPAMFFSGDEDTGKVLCMAQVPKDIISGKGLKANEWCQQVQGIINGKGGGKPENAQASGTKPQVNEYVTKDRLLNIRFSKSARVQMEV